MAKKIAARKKSISIIPGGIDEYIDACPVNVRKNLKEMRAAIRAVAPDAIETLSYFNMPGYSYGDFEYNGMFAWFSFKSPFVRLHVRPFALIKHQKDLERYLRTKAIVSFLASEPLPKALVIKLVRSSLWEMKRSKK